MYLDSFFYLVQHFLLRPLHSFYLVLIKAILNLRADVRGSRAIYSVAVQIIFVGHANGNDLRVT